MPHVKRSKYADKKRLQVESAAAESKASARPVKKEPQVPKPAPKTSTAATVEAKQPQTPQSGEIIGSATSITTYHEATTHRAPLDRQVKESLAALFKAKGHEARAKRANEMLDHLVARFNKNGFANPFSVLVMSHHLLDLAKYAPERKDEVFGIVMAAYQWQVKRLPDNLGRRLQAVVSEKKGNKHRQKRAA